MPEDMCLGKVVTNLLEHTLSVMPGGGAVYRRGLVKNRQSETGGILLPIAVFRRFLSTLRIPPVHSSKMSGILTFKIEKYISKMCFTYTTGDALCKLN